MENEGKFKIVDLFSGIGNFRAAFEKAGAVCVYSVEWDKYKRKIYETIYEEQPNAGDIAGVEPGDIPYADLWTFGSPCQNFSISGRREGLNGNQSSMVREVFRLLKGKEPQDRPTWILLENVKGILSCNRGWDFACILRELDECGYDCEWDLLNAKDFGIPHNRERMFLVGHFRNGRSRQKVFPLRLHGEQVALT